MEDNPPVKDWPLICLHPIADAQHGWAALLLDPEEPLSCEQLTRLFGESGLFEALGTLSCVVPLASPHVSEEIENLLPAEQVVLRLPVDACVEATDCAELHRLRTLGFQPMAEGLPPNDGKLCPDVVALAIDCVDVSRTNPTAVLSLSRGPHLALGVDTMEDFARCSAAGFHWFAGNYPMHIGGGHSPRGGTRHGLLLRLLTLITHDAESHEIENLMKQDAHLSYQLLRLVNSVAFSLSREITSFGQAITLLGRRQLQRWLQLLLYARQDRTAKSPLLPRAALRAGLMEAICAEKQNGNSDQAFMVGMFSLLDRLMGVDLADVLAPLHLPSNVNEALTERSGPLGLSIRAIEAAEIGDHAALAELLAAADIDRTVWLAALVRGYHWAIQVSREA
jgi:EAL and modified HD-GYP domain-containing signal transduction protein